MSLILKLTIAITVQESSPNLKRIYLQRVTRKSVNLKKTIGTYVKKTDTTL